MRLFTFPPQLLFSLSTLLLLLRSPSLVAADCECGYTVNTTFANSSTNAATTFTHFIETDFLHLTNLSNVSSIWLPQNYTIPASIARGPYGKNASLANVLPNPVASTDSWSGPGTRDTSHPGGLQLLVRPPPSASDSSIPIGELITKRSDILSFSFRASIQLPSMGGTCGALTWYWNDTQEIDMEVLSGAHNGGNDSHPIHLILQSEQSLQQSVDAQRGGTFLPLQLPFDPTDAFHEYRIDFIPSPPSVTFYADGLPLTTISRADALPDHAGHITLSHWSNGDPAWTGGPPSADAVMTVAWVKGYFNVAAPPSAGDCHADAGSANGSSTCSVPDTIGPPSGDNNTGTWFTQGGASNASGGSTSSDDSDGGGGSSGNRSAAKKGLGAQVTVSATMSWFAMAAAAGMAAYLTLT